MHQNDRQVLQLDSSSLVADDRRGPPKVGARCGL